MAPSRLLSFLWMALLVPGHLAAQELLEVDPLEEAPPAVADSLLVDPGVSPKGAFLRAALLPGWGHASIGSYTRGAFYFAAEATTAWGIFRTQLRIDAVRDRVALREGVIRSRMAAQGATDEEITAALDEDEVLQDLGDLTTARQDEREDWAAFGIFLVFLAGADAFVSAHLKDFPAPITLDAAPMPGGRVELSLGVRLPN